MINCTVLKPRILCNVCSNIQTNIDATHCNACGKSFILGQQDAWNTTPLSSNTFKKEDTPSEDTDTPSEDIPQFYLLKKD